MEIHTNCAFSRMYCFVWCFLFKAITLERALTRSITQCYALEGTYPPDINYLTDHYGLTYDSDYYYIDYQYIGSNLRPDVTIIERK